MFKTNLQIEFIKSYFTINFICLNFFGIITDLEKMWDGSF